jgi:hypothetical protein
LGEEKLLKKKKKKPAMGLFSQGWRRLDMPCWLCHAVFSQLLGAISG